jgi:hypothetical protein
MPVIGPVVATVIVPMVMRSMRMGLCMLAIAIVRMVTAMIVAMLVRLDVISARHDRHALDPFLAVAATANAAHGRLLRFDTLRISPRCVPLRASSA